MNSDITVVNIKEKLSLFNEVWVPKIIGEINDTLIKAVKFKGEYCWHNHINEDELFLVIKGKLVIELEGKSLQLEEGEFVIIPKGVNHKPVAEDEAHIILIEPKMIINTGDVREERTLLTLDSI
jgi:mannose-6-phosphate isomerase-like protein (cupin superfamily)